MSEQIGGQIGDRQNKLGPMDRARSSTKTNTKLTPAELVDLASDRDAVIAKVLLSLAQQSEPNAEATLEDIVKALFNAPRPEPVEDVQKYRALKAPRLMFRVSEVAESLGLSRTVVYQLIRAERLRTVKIGKSTRIRSQDLEAFIDSLPVDTWNQV